MMTYMPCLGHFDGGSLYWQLEHMQSMMRHCPLNKRLWHGGDEVRCRHHHCDFSRIDQMIYVGQHDAEETTRRLAREEGIFAGVSSGGALFAALELSKQVENAVIVSIVCDRGDRYLSTGVFPA